VQCRFPCSSSTRLFARLPCVYCTYAQIGQLLLWENLGRCAHRARNAVARCGARTPSSIPGPNRDNPGNILIATLVPNAAYLTIFSFIPDNSNVLNNKIPKKQYTCWERIVVAVVQLPPRNPLKLFQKGFCFNYSLNKSCI
jgi:hypothetical protein